MIGLITKAPDHVRNRLTYAEAHYDYLDRIDNKEPEEAHAIGRIMNMCVDLGQDVKRYFDEKYVEILQEER